MRGLLSVPMAGPLASSSAEFRDELQGQGYSPWTVVAHLRLMGHLSRWIADPGGEVLPLTTSGVTRFLQVRRAEGYRTFVTMGAAGPLLDYLRRRGQLLVAAEPEDDEDPAHGLLGRFANYLRVERGLAEVTIGRRVVLAGRILSVWGRDDRADLRALTAGDVTELVVDRSRETDGSVTETVTALRSLLRFLHVAGIIEQPLVSAVPSLASWKLTGLPKAVSAEQVTALLASCDLATVVGRRDLVVLMLLARLGLRAGEVAGLRLDDIDWRSGQITVHGKGNRSERLPLPWDVGEALVAYLTDGHPGASACQSRVIARVRAPQGPLSRTAVSQVVHAAAQRAGLEPFYAHRLRHTAATEMLRAGGSLDEIGQVLRHRRRLTTAIYAKVDLDALRTVARPWPGIPS